MAANTRQTEPTLSPEQFLIVTRNLPDPLLLVARNGTLLVGNLAAERALGRSPLPGIQVDARDLLRVCARSLSPVPGRLRLFDSDYRCEGHRLARDSDAVVLRFWDSGEPDAFVLLQQRIAELANEVVRRRSSEARLEVLLETRERFLGILGHDLRTPLNVISLGATQLLRRRPLADSEHRTLARIAASADRMERMIRDLLDFARASFGGGIPVVPGTCDLGEICATAVQEQEVLHADRSISLRCGGSLVGRWDRDRLLQVLANLLGNALEYGTDPIEIAARGERHEHVVEVTNRGTIPPEARSMLFEPFRTGAESERKSTGLGLGLYIVREIVHAHGGRMNLVSENGSTCFTLRLPAESRATASR